MKARLPQGYGNSRGDMMKQLQEMQENMASMQAELAERSYSAAAGGGMVEATVKGDHTLTEIKINPEVVDPDDVEMLGDLIVAAVNEAMNLAAEDSETEMNKVTGGIDLSQMGL